jgi:hypothetical protein
MWFRSFLKLVQLLSQFHVQEDRSRPFGSEFRSGASHFRMQGYGAEFARLLLELTLQQHDKIL